ncbi:hypothetical protein TNCV_4763101 [Trichonephila clavipes]|nr:hypothetical protein TNCV_4763101 [Trichonephila clavipes]
MSEDFLGAENRQLSHVASLCGIAYLKLFIVFRDMEVLLNSRRAASPLVRLVEGEERWEAPDHSQGVLLQNCGGAEQNRSVTCMVLKAKSNDRRKILALNRDDLDL